MNVLMPGLDIIRNYCIILNEYSDIITFIFLCMGLVMQLIYRQCVSIIATRNKVLERNLNLEKDAEIQLESRHSVRQPFNG